MDRPEFRDNNEQLNNNEIQISISEDCMSATLYLSAPYYDVNTDNNSVFTYDQVIGELSDKGVKMGIDDAMLHKMIEERIYNRNVVIAQGKQMVNGEDGRYEFFFDMDVNGKPTIRSDGTVDYMNLKLFESVKEGQLLAKYYHPTKGIFGFDVKGRLLTPKPGKPKSVLRGKGFKVSENGDEYYAALSGKVEYRNYDLKVINLLEIDGDVDLNTGNIDFDGDVNVKGNVITGIRINALGNIYIGGHVEGAVITTQKDLILQEGINAKGIGKIYAKGNITGRFFENAEVYAEGDVNAGYILNSNITAIGKIIIDGAKGVIYGGELTGVMGIETPLLGNNAHTITTVRVGPSKKLQTEYANLLIKIKEIDNEIGIYDNVLKKFDIIKKSAPDKLDRAAYTKVFQSKIIKTAEKAKFEEECRRLFDIIRESGRSSVKIQKAIYPGAKVFIDDAVYQPVDEMNHITIRKVNEKIVVRDYDD